MMTIRDFGVVNAVTLKNLLLIFSFIRRSFSFSVTRQTLMPGKQKALVERRGLIIFLIPKMASNIFFFYQFQTFCDKILILKVPTFLGNVHN